MGSSDKAYSLSRRNFIKSAALTMGAVTLALLSDPLQVAAMDIDLSQEAINFRAVGRLFKGTLDGQILESADAGKTWQRVMNFGPDFAVRSLVLQRGQLFATLIYKGLSFSLHSPDGRTWYSV